MRIEDTASVEKGWIMFTNYFFAKVGYGNGLLSFPIKKRVGAFFWIGYSDREIPILKGESFDLPKAPKMDVRDFYYLTLAASSDSIRSKCRVITFSESNMQIWKLKAPVAYITDEEASLLVDEYGSLDEVTERYERTGTGVERLSFFDNLKGTKTDFGCKSIRVDLELEVPRDLLPACVDSLSVHRFLNSGTFRYLHSANNALVPETVLPDFLPTTGEPLSLLANSPVKEGKFGCFVRKYFDWLRDVANQMSFQETYGLTDPEIFTLCTSIMSPAQLETAASILVNSLGLTLDVGVGKGLDVVDVRASVRHQKDWKGRIETIISELTTLMGGNIKPEIAAFLRKNGTLVIQCKDYNHKKDVEAHGHLIYFQPTGVSNGRVLTLASVRSYLEKNTEALASFHDWLSLVQFNYKVGKNILGLSGASATEQ